MENCVRSLGIVDVDVVVDDDDDDDDDDSNSKMEKEMLTEEVEMWTSLKISMDADDLVIAAHPALCRNALGIREKIKFFKKIQVNTLRFRTVFFPIFIWNYFEIFKLSKNLNTRTTKIVLYFSYILKLILQLLFR